VNKRLGKLTLNAGLLLVVMLLVAIAFGPGSALAKTIAENPTGSQAWSFAVMGDTQWTTNDPAGQNPNGVAVSIINQLNQQFVKKGVKFVVQVGDLTENGNNADLAVRAAAAQTLYNNGIGFFPMRGNHETYASPANNYAIPAFLADFPQTQGASNTFGARNFSSPVSVSSDLKGMSYSFDFGTAGNNARFVIIDDWATPSKLVTAAGYPYGYSVADQQSWISSRLNVSTRGTQHAFVFSHQNLIGENHQDSLFSGYTNANPDMQNAFFSSLDSNGVGYYLSGHDHIMQRSIIASPDGKSSVEELISASDSSKFYTPKAIDNANWFGQKVRETSVSQEMQTVGFCIFTVDGPRVTVDYYSDNHGLWASDASFPGVGFTANVTPSFTFVKNATFGYSTNGREFLVGGTKNTSYTAVQDSYDGTTAKILSGAYGNTATDYQARILTQTVDTGWAAANSKGCSKSLASNVLTLWGMAPLGAQLNDVGAGKTETYTLSLSYKNGETKSLGNGRFGIAVRDNRGDWVNAVDKNFGGSKQFVMGPWKASYGLGTYGVDPSTKTVWAVLNYNADFAAACDLQQGAPGHWN
jgi:hypothetical protein